MLGVGGAARAQQPGVHYDPGSPAGKEYAIPLDQARHPGGGGGAAAGTSASSGLFGDGITARGHAATAASPGDATPVPRARRPARRPSSSAPAGGAASTPAPAGGAASTPAPADGAASPPTAATPSSPPTAAGADRVAARIDAGGGPSGTLVGGGVALLVLLVGGGAGLVLRRSSAGGR